MRLFPGEPLWPGERALVARKLLEDRAWELDLASLDSVRSFALSVSVPPALLVRQRGAWLHLRQQQASAAQLVSATQEGSAAAAGVTGTLVAGPSSRTRPTGAGVGVRYADER